LGCRSARKGKRKGARVAQRLLCAILKDLVDLCHFKSLREGSGLGRRVGRGPFLVDLGEGDEVSMAALVRD